MRNIAAISIPYTLFTLGSAILISSQPAVAQQDWLSDEQARELAKATVHAAYPDETCFNTYRQEFLEDWVLSERRAKLAGNTLNQSIYFYKVISDSCTFVKIENGRPEVITALNGHEGYYGIIAVDRQTKKRFWLTHWAYLLKPYGTVQPLPSKTIDAAR